MFRTEIIFHLLDMTWRMKSIATGGGKHVTS